MLLAVVGGAALTGSPAASSGERTLPRLSKAEFLGYAAVEAPPPGIGLQVHVDFPKDSPELVDGVALNAFTANLTPEGAIVMQSTFPAAAATGETGGGRRGRTSECNDDTYAPAGPTWNENDLPVYWRMATHTVPDNVSRFRARKAMRRAHQVWPRVLTNCSNPESNGFHFSYLGRTSKAVGYDGVNIVEFRRMPSNALAVNYTWYAGSRIVEVDLRLNRSYRWTADGDHKKLYQIINVATHELGHQIGLDDLSDPHGALTMFSAIDNGEVNKVTLGKGDIRGAALLSP